MGATSYQGPPLPGPRTRVFLHWAPPLGLPSRAPSLAPGELRVLEDATDGPQECPEMPPGSTACTCCPAQRRLVG